MVTGHIQQRKGLQINSLKSILQQFAVNAGAAMAREAWYKGVMPKNTVLQGDVADYELTGEELFSNLYTPFVVKRIVPADAQIRVLGDIHGDYVTLETIITRLVEDGFLTETLKVAQPNNYLVFLGDYINRGGHGVKVLMLLSTIFAKNPDNIIILRGNHETAHSNTMFHNRFLAAPETTFAQTSFLQELSDRFSGYTFPELLFWYDYLPLAAFIGVRDASGKVNYVAFCHGGFELGHDFTGFLADESSTAALITSLDRRKGLSNLMQSLDLHDDVKRILSYIPTPEAQAYLDNQQLDEINPVLWHKHVSLRMGYTWNNFLTEENDEINLSYSPTRRTLYLGKSVVEYLCDGGDSYAIKSVVRGHQHLDEYVDQLGLASSMLTRIKRDNGVVSQWQGMVYTLGASSAITGLQSFIGVNLSSQPKEWSVRHYYKKPQDTDFNLHMKRFLS